MLQTLNMTMVAFNFNSRNVSRDDDSLEFCWYKSFGSVNNILLFTELLSTNQVIIVISKLRSSTDLSRRKSNNWKIILANYV